MKRFVNFLNTQLHAGQSLQDVRGMTEAVEWGEAALSSLRYPTGLLLIIVVVDVVIIIIIIVIIICDSFKSSSLQTYMYI